MKKADGFDTYFKISSLEVCLRVFPFKTGYLIELYMEVHTFGVLICFLENYIRG